MPVISSKCFIKKQICQPVAVSENEQRAWLRKKNQNNIQYQTTILNETLGLRFNASCFVEDQLAPQLPSIAGGTSPESQRPSETWDLSPIYKTAARDLSGKGGTQDVSLLVKHKLSCWDLKKPDPSSPGLSFFGFFNDRKWTKSSILAQTNCSNCGFIASMRAEPQLAGPSTDRLKLLRSTLLDNHPMIPVSGVRACTCKNTDRCMFAARCSLSVCLPISKPTEQVLPQRAAKTEKTANKRWHSFFPSTYSHACVERNVKPPSQLWSEKN